MLAVALVVLLLLGLLLCGYIWYLRERGRSGLQEHAQRIRTVQGTDNAAQNGTKQQETGSDTELSAGQLKHSGKKYQYKENLLTILCLGIDSPNGIDREKTPGEGGQADCVMLAVLDDREKTIRLINVSRDAMVPVQIYDEYGNYVGKRTEQLALQYAYGNGRERSCELMETAVSELFFGIPIHGYCALAMGAIADLSDAVGGVTVTVPEELAAFVPLFTAGEQVTLRGKQAVKFVQARNTKLEETGANDKRIARQKQFLLAFADQTRQALKDDLALAPRLYETAAKQMVTSVGMEQAVYLCTEYIDCSFTAEDICSVGGSIEKPGVYEEFYVDDEALYEMILEIFYEEIP